MEIPILRKDRATRLGLWNYANIYSEDGKTLIATIVQRLDITERKYDPKAMQESEEKYRVFFETAKDALFLTNETGKFMNVNQSACESLGYSREELLKLSNNEIDADPRGYEVFKEVCEGLAKEVTFDMDQRRKDETLLTVEITGSFFISSGKRIFLAIARDITERQGRGLSLETREKRNWISFVTSSVDFSCFQTLSFILVPRPQLRDNNELWNGDNVNHQSFNHRVWC